MLVIGFANKRASPRVREEGGAHALCVIIPRVSDRAFLSDCTAKERRGRDDRTCDATILRQSIESALEAEGSTCILEGRRTVTVTRRSQFVVLHIDRERQERKDEHICALYVQCIYANGPGPDMKQ